MKYLISICVTIIALIGIAYYRYSLPLQVSTVSFNDCYDVKLIEQSLSAQFGFKCDQVLTGESTTIQARSTFQARVKEVWYRIRRSPTKIFEVRVFHNGSSRFSVTAEFEQSKITTVYVKAEPESMSAAEFWSRSFRRQFPSAPFNSAIMPMKNEYLGGLSSRGEAKTRIESIPLP